MIAPRQDGASMASNNTSTSTVTMTMSMSGTAVPSASTATTSSSPKLSPGVIAILAIIAVMVVAIFVGFWLHSKIRSRKMRKGGSNPSSSQQMASQSLSVSTYVGITSTSSTVVPKDNAPLTDDFGAKKTAMSPLIPRDSEVRWMPQGRPGQRRGTLSRTDDSPLGSPYMPVAMTSPESTPPAPVVSLPNPERDRMTQQQPSSSSSVSPSDPSGGGVSPAIPSPEVRQKPRPLPPISAAQIHKKDDSAGSSTLGSRPGTAHTNTGGAYIPEQQVSPLPRPGTGNTNTGAYISEQQVSPLPRPGTGNTNTGAYISEQQVSPLPRPGTGNTNTGEYFPQVSPLPRPGTGNTNTGAYFPEQQVSPLLRPGTGNTNTGAYIPEQPLSPLRPGTGNTNTGAYFPEQQLSPSLRAPVGSRPGTGHSNTGISVAEYPVSPSPRPLPKLPPPQLVQSPQPPEPIQPLQPPQPPQPARAPTLERRTSRSFLTFDDGSDSHLEAPEFVQGNSQSQQRQTPLQSGRMANAGIAASKIRLMNVSIPYEPELPDELELKVGDVVRMLREFDDGWCVVEYLGRKGKRPGAVPRMCLEERSTKRS